MRIRVTLDLEVNETVWRHEYGATYPLRDAEDYILGLLNDSAAAQAGTFTVEGYAFHPANP